MKKGLSMLFSMLLVMSLFFIPNTTAHAQDDITGITLEKEMRAMVEQGIINGFGEGLYKPGDQVTRGQFATFISRALKLPEGKPAFTDVAISSSLAPGIYNANEAKIVNGYANGRFGPNDPITREQMAVMIDRSLVYLKVTRTDAPLNFSDAGQINANFKQAVGRNAYDKIINGFPNGDGTFRFAPQKSATRAESAAFIYRMLETAKKYVDEGPGTGEPPATEYKVETIVNGELVPQSNTYTTFEAANSAITNSTNQVITYNGQIVKMNSGLVISRPAVGGDNTTHFFSDSSLKSMIASIPANQEMKYLESTGTYVKVLLAERTVYVKHADIYLVPSQLIKERSYYSVNSGGELVHSIYDYVKKTYNSVVLGIAPSFLNQGEKYYSWDAGVFYNTTGNKLGTAYQYFKFLPARTKTNYTAEDLNHYIDHILADREALYTKDPIQFIRYKDATKISKIKDLGEYLKETEEKNKINALMVLAWAIHESDFGMSPKAQTKNNLFGIKAYDSDPDQAEKFPTVYASIDALTNTYLNTNYILGKYGNGAALGNKSKGFNVKYASDQYWGQLIAGHMYRIDKHLGKKDFGIYKIGITNTTGLNVRSTPEVLGTNLLYTYTNAGHPVVILESLTQSDGSIWYKVVSDHLEHEESYIYSIFVDEMSIVK